MIKIFTQGDKVKLKEYQDYDYLIPGKIYTVISVNVCNYHTEIRLEGFSEIFSSGLFKEV